MRLLLLVQKTDDCKQKEEKTKEQYLTKNTTKKMVTLLCLIPEAEAKEYKCVLQVYPEVQDNFLGSKVDTFLK